MWLLDVKAIEIEEYHPHLRVKSFLELSHDTWRRCVCRHYVIRELDGLLAVGTHGGPVISYERVWMLTRFRLIRWFCLNAKAPFPRLQR